MKKICSAVLALSLAACSAIPVKKESGVVDTNFDFGAQSASVDKKIAIVKPTGVFTEYQQTVNAQNTMLNQLGLNEQKVDPFSNARSNYNLEVRAAFQNGVETLITRKGFTYTGPYETFDEITYGDKKNSYLAIVPKFDIKVGKTNVSRKSFSSYAEEVGTIRVDGSFILKFIEPLTGQVMSQKRVDLSRLNISEPYVRQWETKAAGSGIIAGAIGGAMKQASKPDVLVNNIEKAYADAMTKFYQGSMKQLVKYVSTEEIKSFEADIRELKEIKRY
ncbi:HpaA family protein [Shewanella sp. 10N.261.52.F9]|uniref:HpaA family protein n=1 Tax=Shewanella sp. 10N.261.52.F9 TaxID=3229684 RepID=UPI00354EC48B